MNILSAPLGDQIEGRRHARVEQPGRVLGLDLLRSMAIMLVLISHWSGHFGYWLGVPMPPLADFLGDLGVDLFFALSGFLIGRILLDIVAARPAWRDFRAFLIRRAMRTLPLYFVWLAVLLAVFPPHQDGLTTALRFLSLTQNLLAPMPPDYYFAVTWSLTVEEWFYLLFGGGLVFLARHLGGAWALVLCLAVFIIGPLLLRLTQDGGHGLVFFRIDEIAYGVAMARLFVNRHLVFRCPSRMLSLGLGLIAAAAFLPDALTHNASVLGCALCLPAASRLTRAARWIEAPVRWIAARSYALYIVHLTVLVDVAEQMLWEKGGLAAVLCALLAIVLPFLLAELSYRFLEAPILRLRPHQTMRQAYPARHGSGHPEPHEAGQPYYPSVAA